VFVTSFVSSWAKYFLKHITCYKRISRNTTIQVIFKTESWTHFLTKQRTPCMGKLYEKKMKMLKGFQSYFINIGMSLSTICKKKIIPMHSVRRSQHEKGHCQISPYSVCNKGMKNHLHTFCNYQQVHNDPHFLQNVIHR
jgi:hypothetical protein